MPSVMLYDDDCGICTKSAIFFSRLLKLPIIPMHLEKVQKIGEKRLGIGDYWRSFHIVSNGKWTTEGEAIVALSNQFPLGKYLSSVVGSRFILPLLLIVLRRMQYTRKQVCTIQMQ